MFGHLDLHVLFKLHWGGKGVKGEAWDKLLREEFHPRLKRMWAEQDYLRPRAKLGYFPCASQGNELIVFDPEDEERELERLVFPRQPKHDRICLADFYRPLDSGERDVVALQAVTAGPEVTDLMAQLEKDGEFAEQLYVHGLGVQAAEGMAEWLHSEVRKELGIEPDQGRRWSWGYPACPEQSEHEKVYRLIDAPSIGLSLSGGFAVEPGAVHARDRLPPPAGGLLRHEVRPPPQGGVAGPDHPRPAPPRRAPRARRRGVDRRRRRRGRRVARRGRRGEHPGRLAPAVAAPCRARPRVCA